MNTYEVTYLENDEKKQICIYAKNEAEAGKAFHKKYPQIKSENAILSVENLDKKGRDYGSAIFIASLMSFLGWIGLLAGLFILFSGAFLLVGITGTIGIISSSLMLIMGGQITRATANNANYSKQMLTEMRKSKAIQ